VEVLAVMKTPLTKWRQKTMECVEREDYEQKIERGLKNFVNF